MQNSMVIFVCFVAAVWDRKSPFAENLVKKKNKQTNKICSLSWNLVLILIQIWTNQRWCSFFLFLIGSIYFGKFVPKIWYSGLFIFSLDFYSYNIDWKSLTQSYNQKYSGINLSTFPQSLLNFCCISFKILL